MNRRLFALHRYLTAFVFLQLALWSASGAFFALAPIERVRGESVPGAHERPLPPAADVLPPARALERLAAAGLPEAAALELRATPSGLFYVGRAGKRALRLDARTGAPAPVGEAEAEAIARRDQPGAPPVRAIERVEGTGQSVAAPDGEYRNRPLPAWRVHLASEGGMTVYVDAVTGDVTARRSDLWRAYDLLWALHIMDYRERTRFNHPLLAAAALLAVLAFGSGAALWGLRLRRRLRRRRR